LLYNFKPYAKHLLKKIVTTEFEVLAKILMTYILLFSLPSKGSDFN
jgi:hypothetical protein